MKKKSLLKNIVLFILINAISIIIAQAALAGTVTRTISSDTVFTGENLTVTLDVDVDTETFYLIDELIPLDWILVDKGTADNTQAGHLKWVVITGAQDTVYTYIIQAPAVIGVYSLDGTYVFEGDTSENTIDGDFEVSVDENTNQLTLENIVVNEFVSNPSSGDEWIELYNKESSQVSLNGWTIQDGSIAAPTVLDSLVIPANGYLVLTQGTEFTFFLNNDGGDTIFLKKNNSEVDKVAYGNYADANVSDNAALPSKGQSVGRLPNGVDTNIDKNDFSLFSIPTQGASNSVITPTVAISIPTDAQSFNVDDVLVQFSVSDFAVNGKGATHLHFMLDNDPIDYMFYNGADNTIEYNFAATTQATWQSANSFLLNNLADGQHTLTLMLANADHSELTNSEAEDSVIFTVATDVTPPAQITNLQSQNITNSSIKWTWTNPIDADFSQNIVFFNGVNIVNTSNNYYEATNLQADTSYTISVQTKDQKGNVNTNAVSNTATTLENPEPLYADDLQVNYVRGRILFDGNPAAAGTQFTLTTTGLSGSFVYSGQVDDAKIPIFLNGNGYFDTGDNINFFTGRTFTVNGQNCNAVGNGVFADGGNGDFNVASSLLTLNCLVPPVINDFYHLPNSVNESSFVSVFADITDNFGVDTALLYYKINNSNYLAMPMPLFGGLYKADIGNVNASDSYTYYVYANDSYGNAVQNTTKSFTVAALDKDNDGFNSLNDCNDTNAAIKPNAAELDNGFDDNCNGQIDEGLDKDNDTYTPIFEGDCNDSNVNVHPGATELDNNVDDDCDGLIDEGFDTDGDNFTVFDGDCDNNNPLVNPNMTEIVYNGLNDDCNNATKDDDLDGDNYLLAVDCNDNNASINPGMPEIPYNGINEDCNNATRDNDLDNDTYLLINDCNDNNASINPGMPEIDNGFDDNCNGQIDEGLDQDNDNYTPIFGGDCNDTNAAINPGMPEIPYNGINEDCNNATKDNDLDGDGYLLATDCNDTNSAIHPNAPEIIDTIDQNCFDDAPNYNNIPNQTWNEDENKTINLNDYFYDVDGDVLSYTVPSLTNIQVVQNNNLVTFVPKPNWYGNETIVFTGTANSKSVNSNVVTLTVASVNDIPTLNVPAQTISEDSSSQPINLNLYSSDVEGSVLAYSVTNEDLSKANCEVSGNMLTISGAQDYYGSASCTLVANDGVADSLPYIVSITVNAENDAPVITPFSITLPEDSPPILVDLNDKVSDVDNLDSELTWSVSGNSSIQLTIGINNVLTVTPNANFNGNEIVMFTAKDLSNASDSEAVVITVTAVNDAPVLAFIRDITNVTEGQLVDINPTATDVDNDPLTFSFTSPLDLNGQWLTDFNESGIYYVNVTVSDGKNGFDSQNYILIIVNEYGNHVPVLNPIADFSKTEGELVKVIPQASDLDHDPLTFSYTAPLNQNGEWQTNYQSAGTYPVTVTVSDGKGGSNSTSFNLTINEAGNQAPVISPINDFSVPENSLVRIVPTVIDPDGDAVTITFSSPLNQNGEWQTGFRDAGVYQINITATDGLLTSIETFTLTVDDAGNQAPTIDPLPDREINENESIKIYPTGSDPDGDALTFMFSAPINQNGEWLTTFRDSGNYTIFVTAFDGHGNAATTSFELRVREMGNHAPEVQDINDLDFTEGQLIPVNVQATDPDGDALTIKFSEKFNSSGLWKTGFRDAGFYHIYVNVSDGQVIVTKDFFVNVRESGNHAPVVTVNGNFNVVVGDTVKMDVSAVDPDGDNVTITISEPVGNDGVWNTLGFDPGNYQVTIRVSDGKTTVVILKTITIKEKPFEELYIGNINFINGDRVEAGDYIEVDVSFTNMGNKKMREVKVVALDEETGERYATQPISLGEGDTKTKKLRLYVPEDARIGEHEIRFTFSNDNVRRVRHRPYFVT